VGTKRWTLLSPSEKVDLMPFTSIVATEWKEAAEMAACGLTPFTADVVAGEMIYVPRKWLHQVESLTDTFNVNGVATDHGLILENDPGNRISEREESVLVLKLMVSDFLRRIPGVGNHALFRAHRSYLEHYAGVSDFKVIREFRRRARLSRLMRALFLELKIFFQFRRVARVLRGISSQSKIPRNAYDYFQARDLVPVRGNEIWSHLVDRNDLQKVRKT
jgi:hypothetical protein